MRACGVESVFKITEAHRMALIRLINCEGENVPANRNGETLSRQTSMATCRYLLSVLFWVRSLNQQTVLVEVQSQHSTLQFSTAIGIRRVLALKVLWSILLRL